jgi:SNF2 family DNA or RNA helicase
VTLPDVHALTPDQRRLAAWRVKGSSDITPWPELDWFNSAPCHRHEQLTPLCRQCGIVLRRHQRIGATWMYVGLPGLLTDTMGSGKTAQVIAVLAMCKQSGELGLHNRAVIVCKAAAIHDPWGDELRRLAPGLSVFVADGSREERRRGYMGPWEVVVVSDRTLSPARGKKKSRDGDVEDLLGFPVGLLFYDDIDPMRNPRTETSFAINRLAAGCTRVHGLHGTPLQKEITELWSFLQPVGGRSALGSLARVRQRYVTQRRKYIVKPDPKDPTGRRRIRVGIMVDNGLTDIPERIAEFRRLIAPLVLRRGPEDLDADVAMPAVQHNPVWVDLLPSQRARYEDLRRGVLRRLTASGEEVSYTEAAASFTRGWQICSGLAALDEGVSADVSVKLDWVVDALTHDLAGEKAVIFVYFKANVAALSQRLEAEGISHVKFWSAETDKRIRHMRLTRFRENPECQVLIGTTTIEQSLNLQVARHFIAVDTILNPARMSQLVHRVRRQGSPYGTVYFHHLLARDTQEDGYLPLLRREQAMADLVWDEESDIFQALTPAQLMRLVALGRPVA